MSAEFRIMDQNWLWEDGVTVTAEIASTGAAATIDASFPLSNLQSYIRSKVVRTTSSSAAIRIVIDLGAAAPVDSFAMVFPLERAPCYSSSASLTLKASPSPNFTGAPVSVSLSIDADYGVITHFFSSAQTYRYWALEIDDGSSFLPYIEIPKLFLSSATQLTQMPEMGFSYSVSDRSKATTTDYGHRYVDIYPNLRGFAFNYRVLTEADLETLYLIYDRIGATQPVCIALDPTADTWDKDRFFLYGYLKDHAGKQQFYNYFEGGLAVEETA